MLKVMSHPLAWVRKGTQLGLESRHSKVMESFQDNWIWMPRDDRCCILVVFHMDAVLSVSHMEIYHGIKWRHARPLAPLSRLHHQFMPP